MVICAHPPEVAVSVTFLFFATFADFEDFFGALYALNVKPKTEEMLVDEMLAIYEQIKTWREKKESEAAQWKYSMWLNSEEREE